MKPEDMPSTGQLDAMIKQLTELANPLMQKQKEQVELAVKLQAVAQSQKSIKVMGIDTIVQLYEGDVRVLFPTKDLAKQYYDNIDKQATLKEGWFKRLKNKWLSK